MSNPKEGFTCDSLCNKRTGCILFSNTQRFHPDKLTEFEQFAQNNRKLAQVSNCPYGEIVDAELIRIRAELQAEVNQTLKNV